MNDKFYMQIALQEANKALQENEIPIGAVIVYKNVIIALGHNQKESSNDPTAHAEMAVIKKASKFLNKWRLTGCTLYVTMEPCPMCAGAILNSRIDRVVFGALNEQYGAVISNHHLLETGDLNHKSSVTYGILEDQCTKILDQFFDNRRIET